MYSTFYRSAQIWRILVRHRLFGELLWRATKGKAAKQSAKQLARGEDFPERLAKALEELGPGFIKIGQMLATRADLIGIRTATALAVLQDDLSGFPYRQVAQTIKEDLGAPPNELFRSFTRRPQAAASVAQVHFAVTKVGEKVAVKVLRPGVEKLFVNDFTLFRRLVAVLERLSPPLRRLALPKMLKRLEKIITAEMDLTMEAAHGDQLRDNLAGLKRVKVPKIHWRLCGKRVLTLGRVEGVRIDSPRVRKLSATARRRLIEAAAAAFFRQVFVDGFFHADLHPGNILVAENGDLQLVDFGIMEHLDTATRRTLAKIFLAFLRRDYQTMATEHIIAGYVGNYRGDGGELGGYGSFDLSIACRAIGESVRGKSIGEISMARVLAQLLEVAARFGAEGQPQLLMLQKNILLTESITRAIMPEADVWQLLRPHLEREEKRKLKTLKEGLAPLLAEAPKAIIGGMTLLSGAHKGLRLHPQTLRELKGGRRRSGGLPIGLWWLLLGLGLGLAAAYLP